MFLFVNGAKCYRKCGGCADILRTDRIAEKLDAAVETQVAGGAIALGGGDNHRVAKKMVGVYEKRVRGNKRRLSR